MRSISYVAVAPLRLLDLCLTGLSPALCLVALSPTLCMFVSYEALSGTMFVSYGALSGTISDRGVFVSYGALSGTMPRFVVWLLELSPAQMLVLQSYKT